MSIRTEIPLRPVGVDADPTPEVATRGTPATNRQAPRRSRASFRHKPRRWLAAALVAVFVPKCTLCLAGYIAAAGAAVELCGGGVNDGPHAGWAGLAAGALIFLIGAGRGGKEPEANPVPPRLPRGSNPNQ